MVHKKYFKPTNKFALSWTITIICFLLILNIFLFKEPNLSPKWSFMIQVIVDWVVWSEWILNECFDLEQNRKQKCLELWWHHRRYVSHFTILWQILSAGTTMRALSSFPLFNDPVKCLYCFTVKFLEGLCIV